MSVRVRRLLLVALLLGSFSSCVAVSGPCTAPSAAIATKVFWDKPSLGILDIRLASVEKVGSAFRFTIVLYGTFPPYVPCYYGFILAMPNDPDVLVLRASMESAGSPRWHVDKSNSITPSGTEQATRVCADCVRVDGDTLTFEIPEAEIGSPSAFGWRAISFWPIEGNPAKQVPDTAVFWPLQASGNPSCPCGAVAVFPDKEEYRLGEVALISVYLTMDATVAVTDKSGGVETPIWTGWVKAGLHDLATLMFPAGGKITIVPPTGPEEITIVVTTPNGCTWKHVARFTVRE